MPEELMEEAAPAAEEQAVEAPSVEPEMLPAAVVVTPFDGVPDGLVYPRAFAVGEEVVGDLGAVALREGWAERPA